MPSTLTLKRDTLAIELRRGKFDVVVDDDIVGSINFRETMELPLEPGRHSLRVRAGKYSSKTADFDLADGANVTFRCYGANLWPVYLASLFAPVIGIRLKRER